MYCKLLLVSLGLLLTISNDTRADTLPEDLNSAVVYAYFRVGDDDRTTSGISSSDFKSQMEEITGEDNQYNVASLDTIIKAQDANTALPPKTIALTFEGSESSFLRNTFPLLKEAGKPFTIFISPGLIDQAEKTGDTTILTWNDVRSLAKSDLATIGMTSYAYVHIDGKDTETLANDINRARERFRTELKSEPRYFSYPYGETNEDYLNVISKQGFVASFGQQSGVVGKSSSRSYLPRFTMVDSFADLDRFEMTATSLPFPASDLAPTTSIITTNPPHPGFTVGAGISSADLKKMKCFASGIDKVDVQPMGARHFEIRFSNGFDDSKGRLNCTVPAPPLEGSDDPRWRWLGFLFVVPDGT